MSRFVEWRGHRVVGLVFRLYLGVVFLAACAHKIAYPEVFALDVATYQLLPLWSVNAFALVVPWIELAVGLMLILGVRVRAAALLTSAMMVSFMIALGYALGQGLDMSCGCFASQAAAEDSISWYTMLRDSAWLGQALFILLLDRDAIGVDSWLPGRRKDDV